MTPRFPVVALAAAVAACQTASPVDDSAPVIAAPVLPGWLNAPAGVARAADLEETAALLCARDTDAVIDEDARHASGLADGQVVGLLRKGPTADAARAALARDASALLATKRATHAGVVVGTTPQGEPCAAMVGARRLLQVVAPPAPVLAAGTALSFELAVPGGLEATLYTLKPDGFVSRAALTGASDRDDVGGAVRVTVPPSAGEGRYVVEVIVDAADGPSDPEVALWWPFTVGAPRAAPFPEVLFPDEGHDDRALTHRAEALLQRLRNEQLIEPFKVSPPLIDVATARASGVAGRGALGHRLPGTSPGATNALEDLRARFADQPRARFHRLAEVQAQASTLAEAWQALLDSPAHRYELVDTAFTHCGVAVSRGQDAAGRPTVTLIALLARRPPSRDADGVRAQILAVANEARTKRGLDELVESSHLNRVATRLAGAMRDQKRVDDGLLGGPVAQVALEADASLARVKPLVVRTDDPLLVLGSGAPSLLIDIDTAQAGVGMAFEPDDGVFYLVVLAGE